MTHSSKAMERLLGRVRAINDTPLSRAYWETNWRVAVVAREFSLPAHEVWQQAGPGVLIDGACADCGGPLIVATREGALWELNGRWTPRCVFCRPKTLVGLEEAMARW